MSIACDSAKTSLSIAILSSFSSFSMFSWTFFLDFLAAENGSLTSGVPGETTSTFQLKVCIFKKQKRNIRCF
jgi:hypothetical protein